jgi:hypothetical protein
MQDRQTGEMVPVNGLNQEAYDAAIPERRRQGIVLTVGEEVDVKGGRFRVASMGRKMIVLEGLPGTCIGE